MNNTSPSGQPNQTVESVAEKRIPRLRSWITWLAWNLGVPLTLITIVIFFFPLRDKFEFSNDEGLNLTKAALVSSGYTLYEDIWNDQPPLFTHMLVSIFQQVGFEVGPHRLLVLFHSSLLLWAAFKFMHIVWGRWQALIAACLIFFLPAFMVLSFSVMFGLPAITYAMLSLLCLALWHKQGNMIWLVLSAILLSISISIKLFTGFLAPIFIIGLIAQAYAKSGKGRARIKILLPGIIWGGIFTGSTLAMIYLMVGFENLAQLIGTHLVSIEKFRGEYVGINWYLKQIWPTMVLAVLGTIIAAEQKRWLSMYTFAWMGTSYLLLLGHDPVWDHHQILVTIPAAMLAAISVEAVIREAIPAIREALNPFLLRMNRRTLVFTLAFIGVFFLLFAFRLPEPLNLLSWRPSLERADLDMTREEQTILNEMANYAERTNWVVTDKPMYAFRNRLMVPPDLAVFSAKRWETGNLTPEWVIETIRIYQPEQVMLGQRQYPEIEQYLQSDYRLVQDVGDMKLYVRSDLVNFTP